MSDSTVPPVTTAADSVAAASASRDFGLPQGWSLHRQDDGIVVAHEQDGAVFVREDKSRSIAECILFYLADDLMDPALPRRYTRTDSTGQKP